MGEEWRPLPGWERFYEISSLGRARRLGSRSTRVLHLNGHGYLGFTATGGGRRAFVTIHRSVCIAFNGPPPSGKEMVLHGDGVSTNNLPSNLRWGDGSDNAQDSISHGTHPESRKRACPRGHEYSPNRDKGGKRVCVQCRRFAGAPDLIKDKHGTRSGYIYGCRCDLCRCANSSYERDRRASRQH